jgi:hypothetical protein
MTVQSLKLRIMPPTGPIGPGRGFYQLEEDSLYVQIGPFGPARRFFSYLESDHVHLDFDRDGSLIFMEVDLPRRQWRTDESLEQPHRAEAADIHWLNFRDTISEPEILANPNRTAALIRFSDKPALCGYYLAESVILYVGPESEPVSIWVGDIVDDLAGLEIAAFRKDVRRGSWSPPMGIPA